MKHSIINKLDLVAPTYSTKQLNRSKKIISKMELFKRKLLRGFELSLFQKRGNGTKTVMEKTGRLNDLSGVYVVSSSTGKLLILGSAKKVLADIQRLTRAKRVKDKEVLKKVANYYGFTNYKMGEKLLLAMTVNWLEVTDETFKLMLKRAMIPHVKFVL
ncbi:hypothetical protein SAMN04488029_0937 [Reichenbachiella faecimaris]|uniref:Uncharacterized protein n=1 Tax=Reichenbachiella faecimaris TaxID=692418 RepID=A0A1W2G7D1_REIFA|nr:hypothetical protein [Reichenbachiella faecimaris]SMD32589.1 hypothetical protein SAMN04488029_0937 [Reichenbachiella faecimaris]